MPIRPIADAEVIFAPFIDSLIECVNDGYDEVYERCGGGLVLFETRTKRSMFRDAIIRQLRKWADDTPGVHFFERGQLKWVGFSNQWIVRVKSIDDRNSVAVSPTEASAAYDRNIVPDSIAETLHTDLPATMLYIGHRSNENAPTIPEISLICNNSRAQPEWIWPLTGNGPAPTLALPEPTTTPPVEDDGVRFRVKGSSSKTKKGE